MPINPRDTQVTGQNAQKVIGPLRLTQARSQWSRILRSALQALGDNEDPEVCIVGLMPGRLPFYITPKPFPTSKLKTEAVAQPPNQRGLRRRGRHLYGGPKPAYLWWDQHKSALWDHIPENLVRPFDSIHRNYKWLWSKEIHYSGRDNSGLHYIVGARVRSSSGVVKIDWSSEALAHSLPTVCIARALHEISNGRNLLSSPLLEEAVKTHLNCIEIERLPNDEGYRSFSRIFNHRPLDLFRTVEAMAKAKYESAENQGTLALVTRSDVQDAIELRRPERISNTKLIRKLLECKFPDKVLCVGPGLGGALRAFAFGQLREYADAISFHFKNDGWEMRRAGETIVRRTGEKLGLAQPDPHLAKLQEDYKRVFREKLPPQIVDYHQWIAELGCGAILLIHENAVKEAQRFMRDSLAIKPKELSKEELSGFSRIDGAFLFDPAGVCHAIGCILDGTAHSSADRSRGSRYNSTSRYVQANRNCVGVVYSEDKHIDVIRRKRPRGWKATFERIGNLTDNFDGLVVQTRDPEFDEETGQCYDPGAEWTNLEVLGDLLAQMTAWKHALNKPTLQKLVNVAQQMLEYHGEDGLVDIPIVQAEFEAELSKRTAQDKNRGRAARTKTLNEGGARGR